MKEYDVMAKANEKQTLEIRNRLHDEWCKIIDEMSKRSIEERATATDVLMGNMNYFVWILHEMIDVFDFPPDLLYRTAISTLEVRLYPDRFKEFKPENPKSKDVQ